MFLMCWAATGKVRLYQGTDRSQNGPDGSILAKTADYSERRGGTEHKGNCFLDTLTILNVSFTFDQF